jgi:hypothetical protein
VATWELTSGKEPPKCLKYDTEAASVCVVWAPHVVTRGEPMDKFGEYSEPAGELHMGVLLAKRRNDLLG